MNDYPGNARYLVNDALRQCVNLGKLPLQASGEYTDIETGKKVKYKMYIDPLPLLLAIGNDFGSGDFHRGCQGFGYVGSWVAASESVRYSEDRPRGYRAFSPDFLEPDLA